MTSSTLISLNLVGNNISWCALRLLFLKNINFCIIFLFSVTVDDKNAAEVVLTETTLEPKEYYNLKNSKIKFWDFKGSGTPRYPDVEAYCNQVNLERYDSFLIFTAGRFTENDLKLARKIKSIGKSFFFVRTKIDLDVQAEKRKRSFNEGALLQKIRADCLNNLGDLLSNHQDIFLISNHFPSKWDFSRLTTAILEALPRCQRERESDLDPNTLYIHKYCEAKARHSEGSYMDGCYNVCRCCSGCGSRIVHSS